MEIITLKNSLRISLQPEKNVHSAAMCIYVAAGNRNESPENMGISHFIEHMVFKGTKNRSSAEIADLTDMLGGNINAFTAKDNTCYYARALYNRVPLMLEILCDMVCNPLFDSHDIETEKGVILEEIGMYEDNGEDLCADLLNELVWKGNPLSYNILGARKTVEAISSQQLREYTEKYYTPGRMVISICGRYDKAQVLEVIERFFGDITTDEIPEDASSDMFCSGISLTEKPMEQTHISYAFDGIPLGSEDRFLIAVLSMIAGGGASSRLNRKIREEMGLAYCVYSYHSSYLGGGMFGVQAALSADNQEVFLEKSLEILLSLKNGISEDELIRTKEQFKAGTVMGSESVSGIAQSMGRQLLMQNEYLSVDDALILIDKITTEDVNKLANRLITPEHFALCVVGEPRSKKFYQNIFKKFEGCDGK